MRDRGALRRWLTAYAAATSTTASYDTIRDAASAGEADKPAKRTTIPYRTILEQLWMIEEVPPLWSVCQTTWRALLASDAPRCVSLPQRTAAGTPSSAGLARNAAGRRIPHRCFTDRPLVPTRNLLGNLAGAPVHQLADPALAARLVGVGVDALINGADSGPAIPRDGTLLGALFQSLVTLSVRVYAQAAEARVAHLRTQNGDREIDLIVQRADHRVVALEVKLSPNVDDRDLRHLRWLADRIGPDLLDAAVITTGPEAYRRKDGIGVIPAALLTA